MPPCAAGSRIKASIVDDQFYRYASDAFNDIAAAIPALSPFLSAVVGQLLPRLVDLNRLCATPPPAPPTVDLATLFSTGQWAAVPQWFVDWFWSLWENQQWSTYCECVPITTCPPTPLAANHTMTSGVNTTDPVTHSGPVPAGAATASWHWNTWTTTPSHTVAITWSFRNSSNVLIGTVKTHTKVGSGSNANEASFAVPVGTVTIQSVLQHSGGTATGYNATWNGQFNYTGTCGDTSVPPVPVPPPPPPDVPPPPPPASSCTTAELCAAVDTVRRMLSIVSTEVDETYIWTHAHLPVDCPDCVQGAQPYTVGVSHPGELASGQLAIAGLVGMRVTLSSAPPGFVMEGQPPYRWDLGWVSIENADGLLEEKRVTRDSMVWLPYSMKLATIWTWTLRPGVVLTATELH